MAADEYKIVLPNHLDSVPKLQVFLQEIAAENRWSEELLFDLNLAAEEIVVNIIQHGGEGAERTIRILLRAAPDAVSLIIEDDGRPFNPLEYPPADVDAPIEDRRPGGLGIHLVRSLIPHLIYSRQANRNRLVLKKPIGVES